MQTPSCKLTRFTRASRSDLELAFPGVTKLLSKGSPGSPWKPPELILYCACIWDDDSLPPTDSSLTAEMYWTDTGAGMWGGILVLLLGAHGIPPQDDLTLNWGFTSRSISGTSWRENARSRVGCGEQLLWHIVRRHHRKSSELGNTCWELGNFHSIPQNVGMTNIFHPWAAVRI